MTEVRGAGLHQGSFCRIEDSTAEDWALIATELAKTQETIPETVISMLRGLKHGHGGFPVDRLEHSLQTATRAERDGRDEEYILCAVLHDVGDTLAIVDHPAIAAAILKPFVSDANHWMVQHHGIFQGYYFWHHLGMDRNARDAFRGSPYFEYTEEFCAKYDGLAFDAGYKSEPLEHFEPLIRARLSGAPLR
jgi:predicted HD phosphohydrolase